MNQVSPPLSPAQTDWKLFIDGAARKNPGPAGAGIFLMDPSKKSIHKGFFLGIKTNNQAEYLALILGIYYFLELRQHENETLSIISDSELLVRQMTGQYKVRNQELIKLQQMAFHLLRQVPFCICHVLRIYNKTADELANKGIDEKIAVPEACIKLLQAHDITI